MSTRAATRRAASAEPTKSTMSAVAPASKRRREDSGSSGAPNSIKGTHSSKPKETSTAKAVHSVVMVQVPPGFSFSQAACR